MNILAIDAATPVLSISAYGPAGNVTLSIATGAQHAEKIVGAIDTAIGLAGFSARETELIACAEGPGSFTGLRLGYAAAKGLQLAANCRLFPIPTLPCYAESFHTWPGVVVSVIDAKKNRFYAQIFRRGDAVTDALDIGAAEIRSYVDQSERILITGPDAELFSEALENTIPDLDITVIPAGIDGISHIMAEFAKNKSGEYTDIVPDHAGPLYVRKSDAETNTKK